MEVFGEFDFIRVNSNVRYCKIETKLGDWKTEWYLQFFLASGALVYPRRWRGVISFVACPATSKEFGS